MLALAQQFRVNYFFRQDLVCCLQSSMMGVSLTIPISHGRLALGTWQGIYLNEHRDYGGEALCLVSACRQKQ